MENTKSTTTKTKTTSPRAKQATETKEELNMNDKVEVFNIAPWHVSFSSTNNAAVQFAPSGSLRLRRDEIVNQVERGNRLFTGIDNEGGHATLYINDAPTREYLHFDEDGRPQNFLTEDKVKELCAISKINTFKSKVKNEVVTRAEKAYMLKCMEDLHINDYDKRIFVESHCQFSLF